MKVETKKKSITKLIIKDNIKCFNQSLKDLLSQEISIISKKHINSNKVNIEKILEKEKDDEIICV